MPKDVPPPQDRAAARPAPSRSGRVRVPFWDNARFALITLVVIGHAIQPMTRDSDTALAVYLSFYAFHMPAFIMIAGYFAKADPLRRPGLKKLVQELLLPYLIFETAWTLIRWISTGSADFNLTTPSWTLWFLLALFAFRLLLPLLAVLRFPFIVSVLISVGVGYVGNLDSTLSMARIIGLLPFFVLGWKLRTLPLARWWLHLRGRTAAWVRVAGAAVLAIHVTAIVVWIDVWREVPLKDWFFYDEPGDELAPLGEWILQRPIVMIIGVVTSAAFLVLVPRRRLVISALGGATMTVYLLHTLPLYPLRETGVLRGLPDEWWFVALVALGAVGLTVLLASPLVRALARPVTEPKWEWFFARRIEATTETGRIPLTGPLADEARRAERP